MTTVHACTTITGGVLWSMSAGVLCSVPALHEEVQDTEGEPAHHRYPVVYKYSFPVAKCLLHLLCLNKLARSCPSELTQCMANATGVIFSSITHVGSAVITSSQGMTDIAIKEQ